MRRVVRRSLTRDPMGREIASESERLTDDGQGVVNVTTERIARRCSGCQRPIVDLSELRGNCDWCGVRGCCTQCLSHCEICSRRLCGRCRRGFAGTATRTVCPNCQQRLMERQVLEDRLQAERLQFERALEQRREQHQLQTDLLAQQRFAFEAQMQMARLRLEAGLPIGPPQSLVRRIAGKVISYVPRLLHLP